MLEVCSVVGLATWLDGILARDIGWSLSVVVLERFVLL